MSMPNSCKSEIWSSVKYGGWHVSKLSETFWHDLVTFGMCVKQFGNDLASFGYWFCLLYGNCKTFGDNIKIFNNKNSFDNNLLLHWTKCYHLTMTSHSATIISFGNNNPKMHCKFANLETRWQININLAKYRDSILTRLETLLNDVTAAILPDPKPHIINHIWDCSKALYWCLAVLCTRS
jgi:hypothetical protein